MEKTTSIREQNDAFRCHTRLAVTRGIKGQFVTTRGIAAKPKLDQEQITDLVRMFGQYDGLEFTEENDPYGEHDFGSFEYKNEKVFWKIDYYNLDLTGGSEDSADPRITHRVLTILLAEEY